MTSNHRLITATTLAVTFLSGGLSAQCIKPEPPKSLNAQSSDLKTFKADYHAAELYMEKANTFLKCIQAAEITDAEDGVSTDKQIKDARRRTFNKTTDEIRAVSENMKVESSKFKERADNPDVLGSSIEN